MGVVQPADERPHQPDPTDPWWADRWAFDVWSPSAGLGCCTSLTLLPNQRRAWYWAALVRPGEPLLAVWDLHAPLPRQGLTVRAEGLWAEHVCEAPLEQWTVANECTAVALDDPAEAVRRGLGDPVPMAFDLEWYATGAPRPVDGGAECSGVVHGVVEVGGHGTLTWEGLPARYRRTWGHLAATPDPAPRPPGPRVLVPLDDEGVLALERVLEADGWWEAVRPVAQC